MFLYMFNDLSKVTADEAPSFVPNQLLINLIPIAEDDHFGVTPCLLQKSM